MQNTTGSQVLFLAPELQIACFKALGQVEGSLNDAFFLACRYLNSTLACTSTHSA